MTIKSMTGFARAEGEHGSSRWVWELRSVNGRNLDVRMRLPPGFEMLDARVRELVSAGFQRGSIQIGLTVQRPDGVSEVRLNEQVLSQVLAAAERVRALTGAAPPSVEGLLGIKGVLEAVEAGDGPEENEARAVAMLASLRAAIAGAVEARKGEGARLQQVLLEQVAEIARLVSAIEGNPQRSTEVIRKRLSDQIARLLAASSAFDEARLHQESVLLATKADVEEELKRLAVHVAAARDLLSSSEAVGRKLDFLAQEFNREANTICSKAGDSSITAQGLSLKTVIEQFREQVQNIE